MQAFSKTLESGKFVVTAELNPPKGTDLRPLFKRASLLRGWVDALNLTDSAGANMAMSPIAAAHVLRGRGIEPIVQFTGRDRNRIALEADMLAASALGVTNLLCMSGDPPGAGDHPDAVGVFDLRAESLLEAARDLNAGADMHGNRLSGATTLFAGAVVNPGADDVERELARMEDKVRLGAAFFQTQGVYDPAAFESFMSSAGRFGVPVLAGVIVLKSARMARFLNARLPGVHVPQPLIDEMEAAADPGRRRASKSRPGTFASCAECARACTSWLSDGRPASPRFWRRRGCHPHPNLPPSRRKGLWRELGLREVAYRNTCAS